MISSYFFTGKIIKFVNFSLTDPIENCRKRNGKRKLVKRQKRGAESRTSSVTVNNGVNNY